MIELQLGKLFTVLGKTIVDVTTQNWAGVSKDAIDAVSAFHLATSVDEQAGVLISRAMTRAVMELIDPYKMAFPPELDSETKKIATQIDAELAALTIDLDPDFLRQPQSLELVAVMQTKVETWLSHVELRRHSPKAIAARLGPYFVHALHRECAVHDYGLVLRALDSEFAAAWQRERSWLAYGDWFRRELDAPMFGEAFGLAQIFIWPRAYYIELDEDAGGRRGDPERARGPQRRRVGWLKNYLDTWLAGARMSPEQHKNDAIRIISGDPGAGKSSFVRMYARHRMDQGDRVLFVPLHRLDIERDLGGCLAALASELEPYPHVDLAEGGGLLLVLDGLDELAKRGRIGAQLAREFVDEVWRTVNNRNRDRARLRVIISGRPVAISGVESKFRKRGQILHLLPYFVDTKKTDEAIEWLDPKDRLRDDQRQDWWRRYGELTGGGYRRLPQPLTGEALVETTSQPLLSYLLALVYEDSVAKQLDFAQDVSRNEIYSRLIDQVYERDWDKRPGGHVTLGGMSREDFRELLEDMALAAWHDRERVTTVKAIERLHPGPALREYAEHTGGVGHLFTAFYMRRHGQREGGEDTFEFTHKSFAEYLTACRIIAQLDIASEDLRPTEGGGRGRRRRAGKSEDEVLLDWLGVCGPSPLSFDLLPYLYKQVELEGRERARVWQTVLTRLIEHVLDAGMPCERLNPPLRYAEANNWAINAEVVLLALVSACARVTEEHVTIAWSTETAFADWWHRLQSKRPPVLQYSLAWFDLSGQTLIALDLGYADLRHAKLCQVYGFSALFYDARLELADLSGAYLARSNFARARLSGALLTDVNAQAADFAWAQLDNTNMSDSDLDDAVLVGAGFKGAVLHRATINDANCRFAGFLGADLDGANFDGATIDPRALDHALGTPAVMPDGSEPER